jgi:hypothetical protein
MNMTKRVDKNRWRRGETNPVNVRPKAETELRIGDFIWVGEKDDIAVGVNEVTIKHRFCGVLMQKSLPGETQLCRCATSGEFEYDMDGSTLCLGERMLAYSEQGVMPAWVEKAVGCVTQHSECIVWIRIYSEVLP